MRRRRRRPKVVWLPNTGTNIDSGLQAFEQSSSIILVESLTFTPGNPTTVIETPMVLDNHPETAQVGTSLAALQTEALDDVTEMGYKIRRIYGTVYVIVSTASGAPDSTPAALLVSLGLMVRRIDPATGQALATGVADTDPDDIENNDDPWLFRKQWVLTPINFLLAAGTSTLLPAPDPADVFAVEANALPRTNFFHTGPHSTPTVDVRSSRRVASEERLFFDVAVTSLAGATTGTLPQEQVAHLKVIFSYRLLATTSIMGGNRRNASR